VVLVVRPQDAQRRVYRRRVVQVRGEDAHRGLSLEREAPGLAEAMRLVNPLGRLSRGVAGTVGDAIVLNTPGSTGGAVECLEAVLDVLPHALRLLHGDPTAH